MLEYKKITLSNGLCFLYHEDRTTPMVALNVLYDVGARDEDKNKPHLITEQLLISQVKTKQTLIHSEKLCLVQSIFCNNVKHMQLIPPTHFEKLKLK